MLPQHSASVAQTSRNIIFDYFFVGNLLFLQLEKVDTHTQKHPHNDESNTYGHNAETICCLNDLTHKHM